MFERKGEVVYPAGAGDYDTVMMAAIEAGAEDVETGDEGHTHLVRGYRPQRRLDGAGRGAGRILVYPAGLAPDDHHRA